VLGRRFDNRNVQAAVYAMQTGSNGDAGRAAADNQDIVVI